MTVTVQYAADHLEELLKAMDGGDSVEIVRQDLSVTRLHGETKDASGAGLQAVRVLGAGKVDENIRHLLDNWDEVDREWKKSFRDDKFGADAA
jgi:hypothetical protein